MSGDRGSAHGQSLPEPAGARFWAIALAIVAVASVLRFTSLEKNEFDLDEYCSVLTASSAGGILHELRNDTNAPLYFFILKAWINLFGISETSARSLSAVLGTLLVALLGLFLRDIAVPKRAVLWAMMLTGLAPLQVFYSQLARGYTLMYSLLILAMWSFARAVQSHHWRHWIFHGIWFALGLYCHNLFLSLVGVFWIAALVLRAGRRTWARLIVVQAATVIIYFPWFLAYVLPQSGVAGLEWIVHYWKSTPPALAILRSLEVLGIGGFIPDYFHDISNNPGGWMRALSILWFAFLWISLLVLRRVKSQGRFSPRAQTELLLSFVAVPLLFQFLYSVFYEPIYIVGRYDTIAQPAYLSLMGIGIFSLQTVLARLSRRFAEACPLVIVAVLSWGSLSPRYKPNLPPAEKHHPNLVRAQILETHLSQDDLVVCLGLEGAPTIYELSLKRRVRVDIVTFPLSTRSHLGWFNARNVLERERDRLESGANLILSGFLGPSPRYKRLWVIVDYLSGLPPGSDKPRSSHAEVADIFKSAIQEFGFRMLSLPKETREKAQGLGINLLEPPPLGR